TARSSSRPTRSRTAIRYRYRTVNAATARKRVAAMIGAMVDGPSSRTVGPWWSERHHSTESCTIGTSANATIPTTAAHLARRAGLSGRRRTARYPTYISSMIAVVVSRGSHVQYAPHTGLPHSDPSTMQSAVNTTPISADAWATRSYRIFFVTR